ncbi:MAG: 23S rRNA (adenine(2503)-C(2))-methyltransferase RlmN [Saprospiraceae bacterium]|nr:23S rRNA (adenine(2503)-C(2))-methyltransferase RlmN [Candidatus Vicinibacter proximus]MBL7823265.1 23S rRNA (adenine(2503)-C(2))-methyltransferase RlmN [Saprospiraceae bacterium]MCC6841650.1 23S rRNA (adenine(2503)-C(2))-methyltransferase RlmN [Saprospiraceae bacterium]
MSNKKDILQLTDEQLAASLLELGFEKYRTKQVKEWLWKHAVRSFDDMSNLSIEQRRLLNEHFEIKALKLDKMQKSRDGTLKFRFVLHDGLKIESVLIPVLEKNRYTVCISSQAGCSLTCSFCATGRMGLLRQLTVAEIFDQYAEVNKKCLEVYEKPVSNVVYMGMGEPLLNYKNVIQSIRRLNDQVGPDMSYRKITVSTAGIAKMIKKLADEELKVNLALSLHAANDEKRQDMMPINEHNNLHALMGALKYFYDKIGTKISYEYIAFEHYNDNALDVKNLVRLCSHFPVMVNIIEYNPVPGIDYQKSSEDRLEAFAKAVHKHGVMITVRRSRGKDIDAACGQLANRD